MRGYPTIGGNISVTTANPGTTYTAYASTACHTLTILGDASVDVEFLQGAAGTAITVYAGTFFTVQGLANAAEISIRRVDQSNTTLAVVARWEA